ncbi:hypothetical protein EUTSA_v10019765mg, partial [Eutrema salsugineum]
VEVGYVCVIAGLVMAQSIYIHIPHKFIMLVMDLERLHRYIWGLNSFNFFVENNTNIRAGLREGKSYTLDGFSLSLQIWIMEAIPVFGTMMSTIVKNETVTIPRCTNWHGFTLLSFGDISRLESTFRNEVTSLFQTAAKKRVADRGSEARKKQILWNDQQRRKDISMMVSNPSFEICFRVQSNL